MVKTRFPRGFTLIELMLVVAIIGLLSAIALPKFANLVVKSKEAAVKGKLGALRTALSIYYSDNEGRYPTAVDLLQGKYIDAIPAIAHPTVPSHGLSSSFSYLGGALDGQWVSTGNPWVAHVDGAGNFRGPISINCTHTDTSGHTWNQW